LNISSGWPGPRPPRFFQEAVKFCIHGSEFVVRLVMWYFGLVVIVNKSQLHS
jgi:hypothetical protein